MRSAIRNLMVLGALGALSVPSLAAVTLNFSFSGNYTGAYHVTGSTITGDSSTMPVSGVSFDYTLGAGGAVQNGTGSVMFASSPTVYFSFDGTQSGSLAGDVLSFYADAAHTQLLNPSGGSASYDVDDFGSTVSNGQFVGTYNPVPEPGSFAAMALGVAGLISRRKRGAR